MMFGIVLLNLYFDVDLNCLYCHIVMFELFLYFLILELLCCYTLKMFCNVRIFFFKFFNFMFYEFGCNV